LYVCIWKAPATLRVGADVVVVDVASLVAMVACRGCSCLEAYRRVTDEKRLR
jgi:hypothetical protein